MTDDHHPDGDEIASAVLDGEATPDEVALVARDEALASRVADLQGAAEAVATPVEPLPTATVDALIATALAAQAAPGASGAATGSTPSTGVVTDLDARRSERHTGRWLAVAAAVLVALALPLALALRPEPTGDTYASVGSAVSGDDLGDDPAAPRSDSDEALAAEAGAGADRSVSVDAAASEATGAAPTTTMTTVPPAPGVADAAELGGVRWLGELGLLVDGGDGVAAAAATALRAPMASTPPTTVGSFTLEASSVWADALRCTQEQVPGGVLEGMAFAGVAIPGDVRVLVVRPPDGSDALVLVVDGVNPSTATAPLACGTVLDVAPLAG